MTAGASAPETLVEAVIDAFRARYRRKARDGHYGARAHRLQRSPRVASRRSRLLTPAPKVQTPMAVYTEVSDEELASFIASYGLGELLSFKGIAEGVENTNYIVHATSGSFILTLYEKRVEASDLPFYLGLMEHLAEHGVTCPTPVRDAEGRNLRQLAGRPAALVTFLEGIWVRRPTAAHCAAVGTRAGRVASRRRGICHATRQCARPDRLATALSSASRAAAGEIAPDLAPLVEGELEIPRSQLAARPARGRYPRRPFSR